jgi:hypothetical protein
MMAPTMTRAEGQQQQHSVGYTHGDPLQRPINDAGVFWATLRHYANLASVCPQHLATALRLGAVRGEPVTAALIRDASKGLAGAGYVVPPAPPPPPDPVVLGERAAFRPLEQRRGSMRPRGPRRAA